MIYLISYDLNRGKDYTRLITHIEKKYPKRARVLYSQWLIQSEATPKQVGDDLLQHMDSDDGLMVSEMLDTTVWRTLLISDATMQKWIAVARHC